MSLNEINRAARKFQVLKIDDLPSNEWILVNGLEKVKTRFGDTVVMEILENNKVYLPAQLSKYLYKNGERFTTLQEEIGKSKIKFRVLPETKNIEFVTV